MSESERDLQLIFLLIWWISILWKPCCFIEMETQCVSSYSTQPPLQAECYIFRWVLWAAIHHSLKLRLIRMIIRRPQAPFWESCWLRSNRFNNVAWILHIKKNSDIYGHTQECVISHELSIKPIIYNRYLLLVELYRFVLLCLVSFFQVAMFFCGLQRFNVRSVNSSKVCCQDISDIGRMSVLIGCHDTASRNVVRKKWVFSTLHNEAIEAMDATWCGSHHMYQ